jgi:hypothetical protein
LRPTWVQVVAADLAGARVDRKLTGKQDLLPTDASHPYHSLFASGYLRSSANGKLAKPTSF